MTILEFIAAFFGVVSVWYSRKNDILVYPTGLVSVILYIYICFHADLYADAALNGYYTLMSLIGWYNWVQKKEEEFVFPVSYSNTKEWMYGLTVFVLTTAILYYFLSHFTNSTVPVGDAVVSGASATAMWWMARRKIESWYAWLLADVIAVPLFYYKELYFTVGQFLIFLVLAVMGLLHWINLEKIHDESEHQGTKNISDA